MNQEQDKKPAGPVVAWPDRLEFDLRRKADGGYSGGLVARDFEGSLSFVYGNTYRDDREYVIIEYRGIHVIADRDDGAFGGLTEKSPLADWYAATLRLLVISLTPERFLGVLETVRASGAREGAKAARYEIRKAIGLVSSLVGD